MILDLSHLILLLTPGEFIYSTSLRHLVKQNLVSEEIPKDATSSQSNPDVLNIHLKPSHDGKVSEGIVCVDWTGFSGTRRGVSSQRRLKNIKRSYGKENSAIT